MLQSDRSASLIGEVERPSALPAADILIFGIAFIRRNLRLILVCLAATIGSALAYLLFATPSFDAQAILYIEKPQIRAVQFESATGDSSLDSRTVDSQVEILKSEAIAMSVVKKLQLADNAAFIGRRSAGLTAEQDALRALRRNLSVSRVGLSAVIKIDFRDSDPNQAARIANAVANAYIDNRINATNQAAETATSWLEARLRDLQKKAADAEKRVQDFQAKNEVDEQTRLSDLQATARTYRRLYDSFLQRYAETGQQQSFQFAEGQVVSPALPPAFKSRPSAILVLPIAVLGGLCLGLGLAAWRELSDRTFRTPDQIAARLNADCLGALEWIQKPYWRPRSLHALFPKRSQDSTLIKSSGLLSHALMHPKSRFAETIRAIRFACDSFLPDETSKIIGFTSALQGEGKSTIAANFAQFVSRAERRVLLIDADFRNRTLSGSMTPRASKGWCDLALAQAPLDQVLRSAGTSKMHFLPLLDMPEPFEWSEFLNSESVRTTFEALRQQYDYIVLDMPPLSSVIDVRTSTSMIDAFVLVVEWGKTPVETVQRALASSPEVHHKVVGAVLNKTDLGSMHRYTTDHHNDCYFREPTASF